jgi:hypothetical protein
MRQRLLGVVEVNDFLQALQIPVVVVLLHEVGPRSLVDIAQGGRLEYPSIEVSASNKIPDAASGKRQPQWMKAITES